MALGITLLAHVILSTCGLKKCITYTFSSFKIPLFHRSTVLSIHRKCVSPCQQSAAYGNSTKQTNNRWPNVACLKVVEAQNSMGCGTSWMVGWLVETIKTVRLKHGCAVFLCQ